MTTMSRTDRKLESNHAKVMDRFLSDAPNRGRRKGAVEHRIETRNPFKTESDSS